MIKNTDISKGLAVTWVFKLYVCGESPRALNAYCNLKKVCDERLDGQYKIEVVDIVKNPGLAFSNNIMACPTVIKESPTPKRVVIGDLSKTEVVLAKLEFPNVPLVPDFTKRAKSVSFTDACSNFKGLLRSIRETNFILQELQISFFPPKKN